MKALSIRQPWAWLIVNGYKDIENRDWSTMRRGPVLIHASKGMTRAEYDEVEYFLAGLQIFKGGAPIRLPSMEVIDRGGIVCIATITDCVSKSDSPWFFGKHGFVLRDATPLQFVPFKGMLGFFDVPDSLVQP